MRLQGLALFLDDPINIGVRPPFAITFGRANFRAFVIQSSGSSGSIVIVTRCPGATPRRANSSATFPAVLSMNSGCVVIGYPSGVILSREETVAAPGCAAAGGTLDVQRIYANGARLQ